MEARTAGISRTTIGRGGRPLSAQAAESLASTIKKAVCEETGHRVQNLAVVVNAQGVRLIGRCRSFYVKQMAQHAAMSVTGELEVINSIEVTD